MENSKNKVKRSVKNTNVRKKTGSRLTVPVYDLSGREDKTIEVPGKIFSVEVKPKLLAQYVRIYLANQRQGTASAKTRSDVVGSTRKIYRQKGTGKARHGDIKAPIFVGGGVAGAVKPKDHSLNSNRKQRKLALLSALTLKFKENGIFALSDQFLKMEVKTKLIANFLKNLKLGDEKLLFVISKKDKNNLRLAARNLKNVRLIDIVSLNPYEILRNRKIFFSESVLQVFAKHYLDEN